jgi:tetratricopeptide (TPR) repeat protein
VGDKHLWIIGPSRASRAAAAARHHPDVTADCHRRLRGPYTGTGSVMRALVPEVHTRDRTLCARHAIEILAVAPELEALTGPAPDTLTSLASPEERTRWYSRYRTRRIAHGIVDFLRKYAADGPLTLAFESVSEADPTDVEFLSIALRRLDPGQVQIIVCLGQEVPELRDALAAYAMRQAADTGHSEPAQESGAAAAAAFVASDGTSDIPGQREAYLRLGPSQRARLHDQRAAELEGLGEWSLRLGAIPYHLAHGSSAATAGEAAYAEAVSYCIGMAFYAAGLELTGLLAPLIDADAAPKAHYQVQTQRCQCLALLERPDETEPIYYDLLARSSNPPRHMNVCYALAMLYTRLYGPEHKDHRKALAHVNTAIALAGGLEDPLERAFHTVFMSNGKALVEMHLGNLAESLRLVDTGIARLDRELPPGNHRLHRSVLHHNRGQVLSALGRHEEALADFDHVIGVDPNYPEYRFDRGNLYSKLGRYTEAIADYEAAMRLTPPFPELYFNRGDARAATGDAEGAISDFRYVLDLEPDYLEARISLASLLLDVGQPDAAAAEARTGLEITPLEARLHTTLGLALLDQADCAAARQAFDRALELEPGQAEALVNRAVAAYEEGHYEAAAADLTSVLSADPGHPDLLFNRALAYEAAGRVHAAIADYTEALRHPDADQAELLYHRGRAYLGLGRQAEARTDLRAHLALGSSSHEQEVSDLLCAQPLALSTSTP